MKTVDRAFFVASGAQLVTIVSNRVELHKLEPTNEDELRALKLWTVKVTYAVSVAEAPRAGRLIVTDTSGRHFGIDAATGEILWKVLGPGEGSSGVIVPDTTGQATSGEMFAFISWRGVMQRLDPATGAELAPLHSFGHRVPKLWQARGGGALMVEKSMLPERDERSLCRLDLDPVTLTEITPITASFGVIPSPDLTRMIAADSQEIVPGDREMRCQTFAVVEIATGRVLAERRFVVGHWPVHDAFWSPDGRWIAIFEGNELQLLDAGTLETRGGIDAMRHLKSRFHPDARHLCVCRKGNSAIVPLSAIVK